MSTSQWGESVVHLLALASRLEGEGQYNLAKICRAAVEAAGRSAAHGRPLPSDKGTVLAHIQQALADLGNLGIDASVVDAMRSGAAAFAEGRAPDYATTPNPCVCRVCGHMTLAQPSQPCPSCGAWPDTFQQFFPVYWFDLLDPFSAIKRLQQTPVEAEALLDGLSEEAMNRPPAAGEWAIRNIVTHMRDAQGVLAFRLDLLLEQENPELEMKFVWTWANRDDAKPPAVRDIFAEYKEQRAAIVAKLQSIPLAAWWRTGRHQEFGVVTVRQQVSYFASHELTHLPEIAALRRAFGA